MLGAYFRRLQVLPQAHTARRIRRHRHDGRSDQAARRALSLGEKELVVSGCAPAAEISAACDHDFARAREEVAAVDAMIEQTSRTFAGVEHRHLVEWSFAFTVV